MMACVLKCLSEKQEGITAERDSELCHEDICYSGDTTARILDVDTRWV